jgi:2-polyprenyl-3-methyl-5-hydroxy-6-metoxy-1,4-benzoquinol methylase
MSEIIIPSYDANNPAWHRQSPETGLLDQINIRDGYKILDVGCGCGNQCYAMSAYDAEVVGIDLQNFMIEYARQFNMRDNTTYICGDFFDMDVPDDYYDIILCQNVMFHIEDKVKFLIKIYKSLKRGGQFVFTDLTLHNTPPNPEFLAYPVSPDYYSRTLKNIGFTNILYLWERHWIWDGAYSGNNYCMFKASK